MAQKFIINNNEIRMGNVELHEQLLGKCQRNQTVGGGRWYLDREKKICYFWGRSIDFGSVTLEQFTNAFTNSLISPFIEGCEIWFNENENFNHDPSGWEKFKLSSDGTILQRTEL